MPKDEILMLFIDSISAFHHADMWKVEQAALAANSARSTGKIPQKTHLTSSSTLSVHHVDPNPMNHVISTIQSIRRTLGVVTFITNWALITPDSRSVVSLQPDVSAPWFGQHLIPPYPSISSVGLQETSHTLPITHHITLPGVEYSIPQFPVGVTFAQALNDVERRTTVEERKIIALVRTPIQKEGSGVERHSGLASGIFYFSIRDDSIGVE